MKITGTATLEADPERVWDAFHDPAVLARCLPGCERLTDLGDDRYAMTVTAGVAAIRGTYDGEVALREPERPRAFTMKATGAGGPGTVDARVVVRLSPAPAGGTDLVYDADASVGGAIGGVGQRMLSGVTRKMAGQFFSAVDAELTGEPLTTVIVNPTEPLTVGSPTDAPPATGPSYAGRQATANANASLSLDSAAGFAGGVIVGGLLALAGVLVGSRLARRS